MLGNNIRNIRKANKLSIRGLSKKIGISPSYLCDLENNKVVNPTMSKLEAIAKGLNVSIDKLINDNKININLSNIMSLDDGIEYYKSYVRNIKEKENESNNALQILLWLEELKELRNFKTKLLSIINE